MTTSQWQERMGALLANYDVLQQVEMFEAMVTESVPIRTWDALDFEYGLYYIHFQNATFAESTESVITVGFAHVFGGR